MPSEPKDFYRLSFEIYERIVCEGLPPSECPFGPDGCRPCWECCHCHDSAQIIEDALNDAYETGANSCQTRAKNP